MEKQKRGRVSRSERRIRLLDKALQLSQDRQYQTITMDQLAAAEGCPKTAIYRALGSKKEAIVAIEDYALSKGLADQAAAQVIRQMASIGHPAASQLTGE
ncbi:hypothetical protein [Aeromonas sp. R7-1]|uniref:hypothetical protein n=1 Tax=Aeromonas sp. R7-1 TaxID=3138473 RepID=UPI0034A5271E